MAAKRKIIQIQALRFTRAPVQGGGGPPQDTELVALCDDGTVWTRTSTMPGEAEWVLVEDVPQD